MNPFKSIAEWFAGGFVDSLFKNVREFIKEIMAEENKKKLAALQISKAIKDKELKDVKEEKQIDRDNRELVDDPAVDDELRRVRESIKQQRSD